MKTKRRRKGTRYPGSKTHGRGRKNRTRGSGNQGGVGMSGTGKRGDQKKTLVINLYGNDYFGKDARGAGTRAKKKVPVLSLWAISNSIHGMVKSGIAKESKGAYEIEAKKYKIVGNDKPHVKLLIKARAASKGAIEAVKAAGGEIILEGN